MNAVGAWEVFTVQIQYLVVCCVHTQCNPSKSNEGAAKDPDGRLELLILQMLQTVFYEKSVVLPE
ncbi:MAG TPA: hypothetical protein VE954_04825 [Oligoflexus sp.]|uniref:hypothetical protein n=1 Tax=Oligoflexus sp. TaxID=1971216 RepID=UPI002D3A9E53|nr:hypothetical protein [Oligoflexus sp.]HYX32415.1 hypothetical protein [Oligoflexus sp.]